MNATYVNETTDEETELVRNKRSGKEAVQHAKSIHLSFLTFHLRGKMRFQHAK